MLDINKIETLIKNEIISEDFEFLYSFPPIYNCSKHFFDDHSIDEVYSKISTVQDLNLYIHIPFCLQKCTFCYYYKEVINKSNDVDNFFSLLKRELNYYGNRKFNNIFIGGGTPNVINLDQLEKLGELLSIVKSNKTREITMELVPFNITKEYLSKLKEIGINRISIGVQSFDKNVLKINNRGYTFENIYNSIELTGKYFDNYNIDFIVGLPGQSISTFQNTLNRIQELTPPSLTFYRLWKRKKICELNSAPQIIFDNNLSDKKPNLLEQMEMINILNQFVSTNNYNTPYSAWFIHRDANANIYQKDIYNQIGYAGIGPSAYSSFGNYLLSNVCSIKGYEYLLNNNSNIKCSGYYLSPHEVNLQKFFYSLKTIKGYQLDDFDFNNYINSEIMSELINLNVIEMDNNRIFIKKEFLIFADDILLRIMDQKYTTVNELSCAYANKKF